MVKVISSSRTAMSGVISKSAMGYLTFALWSEITVKAVTSLPVPLVDGIAARRALWRRGGTPRVRMSSRVSPGCS